ncbi:4881_t:CDS:2 [Diversispora eburnea]|uniref:4881_t:CDS:1 n=1 Tax=Diversispora eburnea TaxID=1213867 RepID=A0A9N9AVJ5_9GLOM|nr:4881_t:CDS:2 [Diversispora eburnea]
MTRRHSSEIWIQKWLKQTRTRCFEEKFSLKLINNEPTLDSLHKRNPSLYTTNTCPFCQIEIK